MSKINSYKDLIVWQKAVEVAVDVFKTTKSFPKSELYGLTSQIRRSAFSIPSNIAEGFCRRSRAEYRQFLRVAFASGAELETQLLIAQKTKMLNKESFEKINSLLSEIMKMLNRMLSNLVANG